MRFRTRLKAWLQSLMEALILFGAILLMIWASGEYHETYGAEISNEYQSIIDTATEADLYALECVVYWESVRADCEYEVSKAVVETVFNRVLSKEYPNTINKVCRQRGQFVCKAIPDHVSDYAWEAISDAVEGAVDHGREVLPSTKYVYFATKKQSYAKNHVWVGATKDGKPVKGTGMYFGAQKGGY